ncbi:MAG: NAD(P)/FAD-dependent oxidoreductase [Actinobacteria bacterium]|nr:NAD(P)/FAD-dependent oxidoreductase [Actinomycetota bacterium]
MPHFDVAIIGSGASGQTVAAECAKAGKSVAVIDRRPYGGTCSLRGCVPKKVLLAGAEAIGRSAMLVGKGVSGACSIDWPELMAFKRSYTDPVPARTEHWMRELGIETIHGPTTFVSEGELRVGDTSITADAFVVATGARPMELGIEGEEYVNTSEDFLGLESLPARIAFIGGGYISFEFAAIAHHAGAQATIVHRSAQVLKGFDPTLAGMLAERYSSLGIDVLTDAPVKRVEKSEGGLIVVTPTARIETDLVVHGAGRVPDLQELDLSAAGIEQSRRGVTVDRRLRSTSNPKVWAIGDAAAIGMPLTPVAGAQGEVAAANILGGDEEFDTAATPSVIFSDPPMARVGVDADFAESDDNLESRFFDMSGWFTQTRVGNDTGGAVLVIDKQSDTIVGAHLLGVDADEVINVFTLAVKFGLTVAQLKTVTWSYPSLAYEINYLTGRY